MFFSATFRQSKISLFVMVESQKGCFCFWWTHVVV